MAINVLMVGGRRCGKTSAFAAMLDQMIHGVVGKYLITSDETSYQDIHGEMQPVSAKINELKRFFSINRQNTATFLVDSGPTMYDWQYKIRFRIPSRNKYLDVEYTDVSGSCYRAAITHGKHIEMLEEYVSNSDVFVVMVDTPYLMETEDYMCDAVNCVYDIHSNVISKIHDDEGKKAKMVIFVPIKCEKWSKEGKLDDVTRKIEEVYAVSIRCLRAYDKVSVCILPIQTAGNIVFSEFKEAWLLNGKTEDRCCKISDSLVRMADGTFVELKDTDELIHDIDAIIDVVGYSRPYAWYNIDHEASHTGFHPYNCDQLGLHILRFYVEKGIREHRHLLTLLPGPKEILKDFNTVISEMHNDGIIKENVDGIKYIKRVF